jgi:general secretion pathway protein H
MAGVRFFPNGSSTGATIDLRTERQAYEVRINWLTGRVSTAAIE